MAGNRRYVEYTSLDPGEYTFRVAATNDGRNWNSQGSTLTFSLQRHYYETAWFRSAGVAVIMLLVFVIFRLRMRTLRLQGEKLENEIRQRTVDLHRSEEQYRTVVEYQSEMINQFLPNGEIIFANRNYCDYVVRHFTASAELIGSNVFEFLSEDYVEEFRACLAILKTLKDGRQHEENFTSSEGTEVCILWTEKALLDENGEVWSYLGVGRDITEAKQAERELKQAN